MGCLRRSFSCVAATIVCLAVASCAKISEFGQDSASEQLNHTMVVNTPPNFDVALKDNQAALKAGKIAPDVGLFNLGVILAHPSNPKADHSKAILSFKTLVAEHPRSALVGQAKTWIQVLEQQQKLGDEKQKLAEEKRVLAREREALLQERQKVNYASEKSRQLDLEIEKRRRQSLSK
jgi:hypothetical protein